MPVALGGSYITLAETKTHLQITDATFDVPLQGFIDAACDIVQNIAGPVSTTSVTGEQHRFERTSEMQLDYWPIISIASVTEYVGNVPYTLTEATDPSAATGAYTFTSDKINGVLIRRTNGMPTRWLGHVYVTYMVGQTALPADVRIATLEAVRLLFSKSQGMGATEYPVSLSDVDMAYIDNLLNAGDQGLFVT